jgi:hypothetical protein
MHANANTASSGPPAVSSGRAATSATWNLTRSRPGRPGVDQRGQVRAFDEAHVLVQPPGVLAVTVEGDHVRVVEQGRSLG